MFIELMNSEIKEREVQLRQMFEKQVNSRGRKRSKKTIRVQELILDTWYVNSRLMRSSEIRIAVGRRVKGLSNYLFFSALQDLQKRGEIIKKKNLLNMKYTFYILSDEERRVRDDYSFPAIQQYRIMRWDYLTTLPLSIEKDLSIAPRFFF